MSNRRIWFERRFELGLPLEVFPDVLERVRGTPVRLEERVRGIEPKIVTAHVDERWSIQENVGHLLDLEELWSGRLDELLQGKEQLQGADLENRKTHEAHHDKRRLDELLNEFRSARTLTVARLERLSREELERKALHPRLNQPMTAVDLFYFVAEHDDHHLARITEILRLTG